jgi:hypothetical protein
LYLGLVKIGLDLGSSSHRFRMFILFLVSSDVNSGYKDLFDCVFVGVEMMNFCNKKNGFFYMKMMPVV